jgi:hypothetical protein
MAKAYGLHQIELGEGVSPEDLEKFMREEWCPLVPTLKGVSLHLLKGVKGRDKGQYLMMMEVESAERYEDLYLRPNVRGGFSEELRQWLETNAAAWEKFQAMVKGTFTDYVVVE